MQMTRSRLQLPPPRPRAALPPAGKVPAGGRLILWAPAEGDHNTEYTSAQMDAAARNIVPGCASTGT